MQGLLTLALWLEDPISRLKECEDFLCAVGGRGSVGWDDFLASLDPGSSGGGPCTAVWTSGTIAYRCRTCQVTASSAICVNCFKAGGHETHDYVMYRSPAGGCCDCGDLSSWRVEGCCPHHRPGPDVSLDQLVSGSEQGAIRQVLQTMFLRLVLCLEDLCTPAGASSRDPALSEQAQLLAQWLQRLASFASVRAVCRSITCADLATLSRDATSNAAEHAERGAVPQGGFTRPADAAQQGLDTIAAELLRRLPSAKEHAEAEKDCLLRRLLRSMQHVDDGVLQEVVTLLLLLLYDTEFKYNCSVQLLDFYGTLLMHVVHSENQRHPLTTALDRLTVQLFNSEEVTVRLVQDKALLETILGVLTNLVTQLMLHLVPNTHVTTLLQPERFYVTLNCYRRCLGDLNTILHHPPAVRQLLSVPGIYTDRFLGCVRLLQFMAPQRRRVEGDVLDGGFVVNAAISLEVVLAATVAEMVTTSSGALLQVTPLTPAEQLHLMFLGASASLDAASEWSLRRMATQSTLPLFGLDRPHTIWAGLSAGALPVSLHLPLHRTAAAFLQALLAKEYEGGEVGAQAHALVQQLLAAQGTSSTGSWLPMARFILLLQLFLSQVAARQWVRNGEDVHYAEVFYQSWREYSQDLDLLMLQAAFAAEARQRPGAAMRELLTVFGASPLLQAAGIVAPRRGGAAVVAAEAAAVAASPAAGASGAAGGQGRGSTALVAGLSPPAALRDAAGGPAADEGVRWLVCVLRERLVGGLPARERLRHTLLHWLAYKDWGYTQLCDFLPSDLQQCRDIDEVLHEIAVYRAPSLNQSGQYSLRKECWRLFDPHFSHFTRRTLSRAWEKAVQVGAYKAHWQLLPPQHALPPSLAALNRTLASHELYRLVFYVLQSAVVGAPRVSEELLLSCLNLLSLALHHLHSAVLAVGARECGSGSGSAEGSGTGAAAAAAMAVAAGVAGGTEPGEVKELVTAVAAALQGGICGSHEYSTGIQALLGAIAQPPSALRTRFSEEVVDCCSYLIQLSRQVLAVCHASTTAHSEAVVAAMGPSAAAAAWAKPAIATGGAEERRELARARQLEVMARMKAQQAAFAHRAHSATAVATHGASGTDEEAHPDGSRVSDSGGGETATAGVQVPAAALEVAAATAAGGSAAGAGAMRGPQAQLGLLVPVDGECIICRSAENLAAGGEDSSVSGVAASAAADGAGAAQHGPLGWIGHVGVCGCTAAALQEPAAWDDDQQALGFAPVPAPNERWLQRYVQQGLAYSEVDSLLGPHVHCCGHMMHMRCFEQHRQQIRATALSGAFFPGYQITNVTAERQEFLCPVCRRLANCLLPATDFDWVAPAMPATDPGAESSHHGGSDMQLLSRADSMLGLARGGAASANSSPIKLVRLASSAAALPYAPRHASAACLAQAVAGVPCGRSTSAETASRSDAAGGMSQGLARMSATRPHKAALGRRSHRFLDGLKALLSKLHLPENRSSSSSSGHPAGPGGSCTAGDRHHAKPMAMGAGVRAPRTRLATSRAAFGEYHNMTWAFGGTAAAELRLHVRSQERAIEARAAMCTLQDEVLASNASGDENSTWHVDSSFSLNSGNSDWGVANAARVVQPPAGASRLGAAATAATSGMHIAAGGSPAAAAGMGRTVGAERALPWQPDVTSVTVGALEGRVVPELSAGLLWAMLAHNLAHYEAVRRPACRHSAATPPVPPQPSGTGWAGAPSAARPRTGSSTGADRAAAAATLAVGAPPLGPSDAAAQSTAAESGTSAGTGPSSVTGLPSVEQAHWRALQSLTSMCCAMGAGDVTPARAMEELHDALRWLAAEPQPSCPQPHHRHSHSGNCSSNGSSSAGSSSVGSGSGTAAAAARALFGEREVPVEVVQSLLPQHDVAELQNLVLDQPVAPAPPPSSLPVFHQRDMSRWRSLLADPYLLLLEMLALGLSAFGGAASSQSREPGLAAGPAAEPGACALNGLPCAPHELFASLLRSVVWPVAATQAAVWAAAFGPPAAALHQRSTAPPCAPPAGPGSLGGSNTPGAGKADRNPVSPAARAVAVHSLQEEQAVADLYTSVLQSLDGDDEAMAGTRAMLLDAASCQLAPLLVRAYTLYCLLKRDAPSTEMLREYSLLQPLRLRGRTAAADNAAMGGGTANMCDITPEAGCCAGQGAAAASPPPVAAAAAAGKPPWQYEASVVPMDIDQPSCLGLPKPTDPLCMCAPCLAPGPEAPNVMELEEPAALAAVSPASALVEGLLQELNLPDLVEVLHLPAAHRQPLQLLACWCGPLAWALARSPPLASGGGHSGHGAGHSGHPCLRLPPSVLARPSRPASLPSSPLRASGSSALLLSSRSTSPRVSVSTGGINTSNPPAPASRPGSFTGRATSLTQLTPWHAAAAAAAIGRAVSACAPPVLAAEHAPLALTASLPRSPALVSLPELFQDLYLHYADQECLVCGQRPDHPGLCLITGRLLCSWWRGCVGDLGGGLLHATECCAGTGLFLSLKSTKVVAIRNNRLAILQSPYLDAHGEEDAELRRGRPLFLDRACYSQLGRLWASSAFEYDSYVLHSSRVDLEVL